MGFLRQFLWFKYVPRLFSKTNLCYFQEKKLTAWQVLQAVLDDEDNENDNIANISLKMMKTIHCRNNNHTFAYHHQEMDHLNFQLEVVLFVISRIQLTMFQSTPVATATAIPYFKHPKKGFTPVEVLEQVTNGSDIELDNHSEDDDAGQLYNHNTYESS